jgi:hypothetical protein
MVRRPSSSCKMQVITEDQSGGVYCHKGDSLQTFLKLCLTQKLTRKHMTPVCLEVIISSAIPRFADMPPMQ